VSEGISHSFEASSVGFCHAQVYLRGYTEVTDPSVSSSTADGCMLHDAVSALQSPA